ncbi:MAG: putative toxin-antitoxin system toxin component, PIN family [Treponema sp.]|nr:putative toxin-antitoxin system toxin component, PIN family [Treponema sp.]
MTVVLDTNIIVSALVHKKGVAAKILTLLFNGKFKILYENRILFEYIEVLSRKGFGFNVDIINDTMHFVRYEGTFNEAVFNSLDYPEVKFHDEGDKKFYEVFKAGEADYLITANRKHFPEDDGIILPGEFLKTFEKQKS